MLPAAIAEEDRIPKTLTQTQKHLNFIVNPTYLAGRLGNLSYSALTLTSNSASKTFFSFTTLPPTVLVG